MTKFETDDTIIYSPSGGASHRMTIGNAYKVIDYDGNDTGWPDGCCGTPFVTVTADDGRPFSAFAYRFRRAA